MVSFGLTISIQRAKLQLLFQICKFYSFFFVFLIKNDGNICIFQEKDVSLHAQIYAYMRNTRILIWVIGSLLILGTLISCGPKRPSISDLKQQKAAEDSAALAAQQRSLLYYESLRDSLLPVAAELLKKNFVYEKDERYEEHGHYVHRLLRTTSNTTRCYIQTYATDDYQLQVKVYLVGSKPLYPESITLSSGDVHTTQIGSAHSFEAEGWHEMLTLQNQTALEALRFIDGYCSERVLATINGKKGKYKFYLSDRDKQALVDTHQLGQVMRDIHQLETQINQTNIEIQKYEHRINHRS